jgi:hypothetical protein
VIAALLLAAWLLAVLAAVGFVAWQTEVDRTAEAEAFARSMRRDAAAAAMHTPERAEPEWSAELRWAEALVVASSADGWPL